jgi:3-oxoacyl-(acyl-carrier-protein) synthase/acyl carrier protein
VPLPVSHAFHTSIVAPASEPLRQALTRLRLAPPSLPIVANVSGELYPMGPGAVPEMLDILARQVASPVQFVKGLHTLYDAGVRVFVEVGPKRALQGFADDVFADRPDVLPLFTSHPKTGETASFNQALCGLYAAGLGVGVTNAETAQAGRASAAASAGTPAPVPSPFTEEASMSPPAPPVPAGPTAPAPLPVAAPAARTTGNGGPATPALPADRYSELGRMVADVLERGFKMLASERPAATDEPVVITGAALGLPGTERIFDDANLGRLLRGEELIDLIPTRFRQAMLDKHITRLVKREDADPTFEAISSQADVIKLAARGGAFDVETEFGVSPQRVAALDRSTSLAIGAGIDALRDAGIPLVLRYKATSRGTSLPDRWSLPDGLRDSTGVIFASAFPGLDAFADETHRYETDRARREQLQALESVRTRLADGDAAAHELDRRIDELREQLAAEPYVFDRRFLFRCLSMGHAQFAEIVGARGPNTHVNAACASTTQAVALAEDWIRTGRCRRVVVIAGDDATSDHLMEWIGAGFLSSGAAATDDVVEDAATPFDRRRHGMIIGMGAAALVVESAGAARERGVQPICEVLGAVSVNSAFHGTRLDVDHISQVMEELVGDAERRWGLRREEIAPRLVFVSHETYTPARGGSAAAEVHGLRRVFGEHADRIVVANTKGLTGHPMGVGIEDVVAVKSLETGLVPPVPNYKELDPDLGRLNLSTGGAYPVDYALRLAAGFGSQLSLLLLRWVPTRDGVRRTPGELGFAYRVTDPAAWDAWLREVSGRPDPELELDHRRLRVKDRGAPAAAGTRQAEREAAAPAPQPVPPAPSPTPVVVAAPVASAPVEPAAPAAATTAPAAAPAPAPEAARAADGDPVRARVLALVAEETGYPTDMLDLDLDLEADLGVDTVKQAEIFASIRESYAIERDPSLKLRDYPTLADVIRFVHDRAPTPAAEASAAPAAEAAPAGTAEAAAEAAVAPEPGDLEAADRVPRRVPVPVLRPPLELCRPTGVTLGEGSRVLLMADRGGVAAALASRLGKLGAEVLVVDDAPDVDALRERIGRWAGDGPVHGVYWLPAMDAEPEVADMDLDGWREHLRVRVKLLYATMRALGDRIGGQGTFLVAGTRLGGRLGYDDQGATAPMGGAVSGFVKAYKRERPDTLVKVVDFEAGRKTAHPADLLVSEALRDPGAVEIGHDGDRRWTVALAERPAADGRPGLALTPESVFVVTGAAGSIVSAIVADLAVAAGGGSFHLLDLTPEPDPADPDLRRFAGDRDGLKRDLAERVQAAGERPTPALVERQLAGLERRAAALAAIEAVQAAGGSARYHSLDLTDAAAVAAVAGEVRERHGHLDVLVHAAGLEVSRLLPDKEPREFDLVFDVKSDGWFNLLHALGDLPLGATVAFSSIAGRFGNAGQTDYSAANDLLCKSASALRRTRPETRAIAIDWTAWAGIGMASRGSIPKMMELAGIDMLPPESGIPTVRRELTAGGGRGEVLVAGRLGVLVDEWDATGGLDTDAANARATGPMIGLVTGMGVHQGIVAETTLDPTVQPFLHHHRIDGTPVLPGVMGMEGFAELAATVLPGWRVAAVEDVRFLAPVKFYRDEPRTLTLQARLSPDGDDLVADCRLSSSRRLANREEPRATTHFTGQVRLTLTPPGETPAVAAPLPPDGATVEREQLYRIYFHGPAFQVVERAWRDGDRAVGLLSADLPAGHEPADAPLATAPRLVELCFQTAGTQQLGSSGQMALPERVGRAAVLQDPRAGGGRLHAVVTANADGTAGADVVDEAGKVYVRLEGYGTVALPVPPKAELLEPLRAAMR